MPFVKDPNRDVKVNDNVKAIVGKGTAASMGHFSESTGGGTPLAKGEKLKDHPEAKRVQQPRDEDGKFTYNSVNGLELKYGPSRGVTVPPILRGVVFTFYAKGSKIKVETPEGKKLINMMSFDANKDEMVNLFKYYFKHGDKSSAEYQNNEGYRKFHDKYDDKFDEGFVGLDANAGATVKKKGRMSAAEKGANLGMAGTANVKGLSAMTQQELADALNKYKGNPYYSYMFGASTTKAPAFTSPKTTPTSTPTAQPQPSATGTGAQPAAQPKPSIMQNIKSGLSSLFSKAQAAPSNANNSSNNKFSGLNSSSFANLFKKNN